MDLPKTMGLITSAVRYRLQILAVPLLVLPMTLCEPTASTADPDLQLWFPAQFIHPFGEKLSASMQIEPRL